MKNIPFLIFISFLFFSLSVPVIAGNDLTITCTSGSVCTKSSELPLFSETNIYPGFTHSQKISIDNNRNSPCHLKLKAVSASQIPDILSNKIFINILGINSGNNYSLVNYPLNDLINPTKSPVSLGHINRDVKNNYLWTINFNSDADNEYQRLTTTFNLNFNFECDEEAEDNSSNTANNPPSNQGTTECTNPAPDAPTHLVATRNSNGSIRLNWTETTSPHDGYLIAFGTSPGNYQYGAPNIGDVSTYTVQGLTYGAQYCFYVRSLNACMPGDRTPEYCVNPGATVTPLDIIPPGFETEVLGATTASPTESINISPSFLPVFFIIALLINLIYARYFHKYKKTPFLISLIGFLLDKYILKSNNCYSHIWLCNYFWIGNALSWIIPLFVKPKIKFRK